MRVREATEQDVPRLVEMAAAFVAEAGYDALIPFDAGSVEGLLLALIADPQGAVLIAEQAGAVIGAAGAAAAPSIFNAQARVVQELFWWVDPAHRHGRAALTLFDALRGWSRRAGAAALCMVAIDDCRGDVVARFYRRTGFAPTERTYVGRP